LDQIPGIGPSRKKELLKKFRSLNGVKIAPISEMIKIPGITQALAETIHETLAEK